MSLQQVLAPQLQQSLALLQAPTLELKALVEQELQQNPVLEIQVEIRTGRQVQREPDTAVITNSGDTSIIVTRPADRRYRCCN
jgi:DNA-directed RNA polymerase specialized sigma54-like protein